MGSIGTEALRSKKVAITKWAADAQLTTARTAALGTGAAPFEETAAAEELSGLSFTAGDEAYFLLDLLGEMWNFDKARDLRVQLGFYHQGGAADSGVIWGVDMKGFAVPAAGVLGSDTKVSPDGTIAYPAMALATSAAFYETNEMGMGLAAKLSADNFAGLAVTLNNAGTASAAELILMYVRIFGTLDMMTADGTRKLT